MLCVKKWSPPSCSVSQGPDLRSRRPEPGIQSGSVTGVRPGAECQDGSVRDPGWAVVSPVKRLADAKTRLRRALGRHDQLVLAMVQDTVRAALACPLVHEVLVVTDDREVSEALGGLGVTVALDVPNAGLNAAIAYGAGLVGAGEGAAGAGVAAMTADLPALRHAELAAVLRAAARTGGRAFVPDAAGAGTTLLAAPPGVALVPRFGPRSAAGHAASGARRLDGYWPSVRRDVDTAADLAEAEQLGLGAYTAQVIRQIVG